MNTFLILNARASQDPQLRELIARLRQDGHDVQVRVSWEEGDIYRYAREADYLHAAHVIVAGGDGSIHEAIQAQMDAQAEPGSTFALGALPYGTGNDFVRTVYQEDIWLEQPYLLLPPLLQGSTAMLDVGCMGDSVFMNALSLGYGSTATETTPRMIKDMLGHSAYTLWGVTSLANMAAFTYSLECHAPEKRVIEGEAWQVIIGNGQFVGGGFRACPLADLQDGMLDVVIVPKMGTLDTVRAVRLLISEGRHLEHEQLIHVQVSKASISMESELNINADGEPLTERDMDLHVLPKHSQWLIP